jgi:type II secretory pathway pseudopilin PulG
VAVVVLLVAVGIIGAIVVIGIVAAIAIPGLLRARMSGNEVSAIGSMRAIASGESTYASVCGAGGFAVSLGDLARPPKTGGEGFVPPYLAMNGIEKNGYRISVAKSLADGVTDTGTAEATCNASAAAPSSSYFASAEPTTPGTTGTRYFATDATGVVYQSNSPIANPIRPSASVVPMR